MDPSTAATLVALLAGLLVTRAQFAQTVLPLAVWSAYPGQSAHVKNSAKTVWIYNAGGGRALVTDIAYRFQRKNSITSSQGHELSPWMGIKDFLSEVDSMGIKRPSEMFVLYFGRGSVIPMAANHTDGLEVLALQRKVLALFDAVDIRLRFIDSLGDEYEKTLLCLNVDRPLDGQ